MYEKETKGLEMEAGIISFKNMKAGFMPFGLKKEKEIFTSITSEVIEDFKSEMVFLLNEILNVNIPFEEKVN